MTSSRCLRDIPRVDGFNAFVRGDMTLKADVGGNNRNNGAALSQDPSRIDVVVGGRADLSTGFSQQGQRLGGSILARAADMSLATATSMAS